MIIEARGILEKCNKESDFSELSIGEKEILLSQIGRRRLKTQNSFLGSTREVSYRIFDLPKEITCPGRTPICEKECYQDACEKMHKGEGHDSAILCARKLNWFYSLQNDFVEKMVRELKSLRPKECQEIRVRIHASGDFYSYDYMKKWFIICLVMKQLGKKYKFVAYTKSYVFLDRLLSNQDELNDVVKKACELSGRKYDSVDNLGLKDFNIHIIASVMDDTKEQAKEIIKKYNLPQYIVTKCETNDLKDCMELMCASCSECYNFPMENIVTKLR